jgi:hypothetical protein
MFSQPAVVVREHQGRGPQQSQSSWPGLVPAIHVFFAVVSKGVDARDKRGHDGRLNNRRI